MSGAIKRMYARAMLALIRPALDVELTRRDWEVPAHFEAVPPAGQTTKASIAVSLTGELGPMLFELGSRRRQKTTPILEQPAV